MQIVVNLGDCENNTRTKNNNRGNFNVMKKTTNPTDVRDYIPCLYCNGFFKQRLWSKHAQKCPGLAAKKKVPFSQKQHNMKSRKRFQAKVAHEPAENYDPEQEEVPEPEVEEPEQSQAKEYQYQCNLCYNMCKRSIFRLRRPIQFPRSWSWRAMIKTLYLCDNFIPNIFPTTL